MATSIGGAFLEFMPTIAGGALGKLTSEASKVGTDAGKALGDGMTKAVEASNKMTLKAASEGGTKAGTALGSELSKSAAKSLDLKGITPDAKMTATFTDAGTKAGKALGSGITTEAKKSLDLKAVAPDSKLVSEFSSSGTKAGKALSDNITSASKNVKIETPDIAAEFSREGEKAGTSFGAKLKGATSGIGALGSALGVQLIGAFDSEVNLSETTRRFQQQLGATKDEAKMLGLAAGSLYANGLASGMDDAEQAISSVVNQISGIKDKGLPAIKEVAEGALGISKAFGQDVDATIRATGQLMRTGLVKDAKEALDVIAGGFQKIPGSAEDLLDTITEYSVQFDKLGLDAKDAMGIIKQLMEGGARNTDLAADAMKEFSIRAVDGSTATKDAFESLGLDADKLARKFAEGGPEARKSFGEVVDALNKMEDPLKRTQAGMDLFGSQWEDLGDAFRKADLKTAKQELGELNGIADQVGGNTFGEKMKSQLGKLSGVVGGIGAALGIGFTASFDGAMDFKETQEKVGRDLGLTKSQATEIGKAAGDLYSSGLGEGLGEVTEAIGIVGKAMPDIAKQGVPALKQVTDAALRLEKNFKVDIGDSTNAVGKLIKTGLVKDATSGFDLIATGLQKIPRAGEDLIDTVNEYSVQFQKLGLTGEDTFGLIKQLMEGGARDTDLAADAIKEFSIRAVDGSKSSEAAFKSLGLKSKDLTATFAKGGPEARAAFGQVTDALNKMEDPVKRNAAGVALFGTQWEDLGGAFKSVDLDTAAKGLGNIEGANKKLKESTPTEVVKQFQRAIEVAFVEVLANKVIPAFSAFINFIKNNQGLVKTLAVAVGVLGAAYVTMNAAMAISAGGGLLTFMKTAVTSTKAWTVAQAALNLVMKNNVIAIVVTAVAALVGGLILLYKNNETVRKAIDAAWKAIKSAISAVTDWFVKTAWPAMKKAFDAIKPTIDAVASALKTAWEAVKKVFTSTEFITALKTAFENFKTTMVGIWKVISGAVEVAWNVIKGIFLIIKGVLSGDFKAAWEALKTMISGVWDGIKKIISGAWDIIKSSVFGAIITYLGGVFKNAWNGFKSFIEGMWNGLKTFFSGIWTAIKTTVFDAWITYIKGPFTTMWNTFKSFFEGLWNGLKTFITTTWTNIKTAVFDAWQTYIKGPFTAMWNSFKSFFEGLWNGLKTFIITTWTNIKTLVFDAWQTYIKGPFTLMWNTFKTFFTNLWTTLKTMLITTWTNIKTLVFDAWQTYIKGPFTLMWNTFKTFLTTLWTTLKTMLFNTWTTIKTTVLDVFANYIKGPFTAMWNAFKTFLTNLWGAIKTMMKAAWDWINSNVFSPLKAGLGVVKTAFDTFKTNVGNIWTNFKNNLKSGWDWVKTNVFTPLNTFISKTVPSAFTTGVNAIKAAWDKVQEIAKTPVRFVANTVLRDGLFKAYNAIASKVNAPTISYGGVNFAKGGVLPGYTPGRDVHQFVSPTGGRLNLSGGEAIMRPEFTRAIGKAGVATLNSAARMGGVAGVRSALGFADGGIVDNTKDALKKGIASGFNGMKSIAATIISPLTGMVSGLINRIPGAGPFVDLMKNAVKSLIGQAGKFVTGFGGGGRGGGGVAAVGGGNGAPVSGGYQAQIANLARAGFNLRFANNQLTGGTHSRTSNHYRGRAIDIGVGTNGQGQVERVWDYLVKNYALTSRELYWAQKSVNYRHGNKIGPTDKRDHIHWAMRNGGVFDQGGYLMPGQVGVNRGRKPEAVLTPDESAGLKSMGIDTLADKLDEVIDAIERVAPGVGAHIRGSGSSLITKGRSI